MEILGYIGFFVLLFLAVTWTIGVRVKLDAGSEVIIGSLIFLASALLFAFSDVNKLHSLWLIPGVYVFQLLLNLIVNPILLLPFRLVAGLYAGIVSIGIPADQIKAAQKAGLRATFDKWAQRNSDHHIGAQPGSRGEHSWW